MRSNKLKIYPKIGFNQIDFSMTLEQVVGYLGAPNSIDSVDNEIIYIYDEIGINIIFSKKNEDTKILNIEFESKISSLWGSIPIGLRQDEVLALLEKRNYKGYRILKDELDHYIFCDEYNISFEFRDGIVELVDLISRP